jgi:hypothetical protein
VLVCNWLLAVVKHFSILTERNYIITIIITIFLLFITIIIIIIISANSGSSIINKSVYFLR